ncbi:MAG: hypothetical protein JXB30_05140 [Anaerolineae bacterium]|nr:hypothetical protein [Anaerolineae bacterium]
MTTKLRPPKRRETRQYSGYTVSGEKSGREARIVHSLVYHVSSPSFRLQIDNNDVEIVPQFEDAIGMVAIGGYVQCQVPFEILCQLEVLDSLEGSLITREVESTKPTPGMWHKFGIHAEFDEAQLQVGISLKGDIELTALDAVSLGPVLFLGVGLDAVSEYDSRTVAESFGENAGDEFGKKTHLYYPEIFYWEHEQPFDIEPRLVSGDVDGVDENGEQVVLKACNRCARFLPIDYRDERHNLGYSNHCVRRAPCTHSSFSRLVVENWEQLRTVDEALRAKIHRDGENHIICLYHGFQLECRPCKKFRVNAPLNPKRNAAQRREDSLRRRAFERLVGYLLGIDWIFYKFRREKRSDEFDTHIWEKFGRRCFACGKPLPRVRDMDLDHTLPLVYLWPLDETATCLCSTCNSQKHDKFPLEFEPYREAGRLEQLAEMTGIDKALLLSEQKQVNPRAVERLAEEIEWFFDEFLAEPDYQKNRQGKKAADLIASSVQRVLDECETGLDLIQAYTQRTGKLPETITIDGM